MKISKIEYDTSPGDFVEECFYEAIEQMSERRCKVVFKLNDKTYFLDPDEILEFSVVKEAHYESHS